MLGRLSLLAYIAGTSTLTRQYLCHYSSVRDYLNEALRKVELLSLVLNHREFNFLDQVWHRASPSSTMGKTWLFTCRSLTCVAALKFTEKAEESIFKGTIHPLSGDLQR
ncbi:MAG: hypothetical protein Q9215_008117 [Flavoplaca cf. flavocitrina]